MYYQNAFTVYCIYVWILNGRGAWGRNIFLGIRMIILFGNYYICYYLKKHILDSIIWQNETKISYNNRKTYYRHFFQTVLFNKNDHMYEIFSLMFSIVAQYLKYSIIVMTTQNKTINLTGFKTPAIFLTAGKYFIFLFPYSQCV